MATQTGSIDLTASNSVKLMAEAGFESVEENYYTKAELDVTVQGINTEVSKKVNGTEIISTINQSAESVSINANKINLQGAVTISDLSSDAQSATLNSNISVGGRNLLKSSDAFHKPTTYNAYDLYLSEPIEDGVPYVIQLWDVDVSHTGKTAATLGVDVYYCGSSVSFGGWRGTSYFTNGHADHLELRFTAYTSGATVSSGGSVNPSPTNALAHTTVVNTTKKYIRLYNSVPNATGTMNLTVGKWKLEKGNTATDWTPAPEDMAVGGRNLLAKTKELTSGVWVYDGATRGDNVALIATSDKRIYQLPSVGYWTWTTGTSYVVSVDARADASTILEINAVGASSSGMKKQFTVGTSWERYVFIFTATTVNTGSLSFYRKGSANTTLYLRRPKLEIGTTATDWSPAPEDVDSAISDAAKTATSYVTDITGGGIMVHPSTDDDTGVRVTSDVDIMRNGYSVINVGTRGDTSGNTDAGVTIYDGSGDSASNAVVTLTGKVDSAGRRRSYIDTGDQTDGSAAEVIGTAEDVDYGSYVSRKREVELFAYAPSGTDSGSVSAWAQTSTDGTFDESGVTLYGKWLNLNHESTYISVPMEQAGAMLSVDSANLTRGSGASSWADGVVRRSGKVVTLTINGVKLASALASGGTSGSITTIPTDYRPSNLQRGTACLSTTGNYANVWFVVSTTGSVAIANRSSLSIPTTAEISLQITYVIA